MVDVTDLDTYPIWYSFCIAMLMGVTHVVLGPDHVSALVLLVAGVKRHEQISDTTNKWQLCKKSAMQGFRWGLGHTIGLTFMTAIFMTFRDQIPMDKVGTVSDYIVVQHFRYPKTVKHPLVYSLLNFLKSNILHFYCSNNFLTQI